MEFQPVLSLCFPIGCKLKLWAAMQTLRGKMWRTFLGLEAVKQEGYYEQLVHQALGNKYTKRKASLCC